MIDIDALEALAKNAEWTGRWYYAGCNTVECKYPPSTHNYAGQVDEIAHPVPLNVAPFIAAANPASILALIAEVRALREDANRWRAFINCARVRLFGWAGYGSTKGGQVREPDSNGYRHFGAEFWTIYDAPSDSMAQEILTGFADAAVAIDAAQGAK